MKTRPAPVPALLMASLLSIASMPLSAPAQAETSRTGAAAAAVASTASAPAARPATRSVTRTVLAAPDADAALSNVHPMENVSMALGEIRMLPMQGKVRRIAVGNGANVSATTVDKSLMLIGEQPGTTTLMVWTERDLYAYRVRVVSNDLVILRRRIDDVLKGSNAKVEELDQKIVITGNANHALIDRLNQAVGDSAAVVNNLQPDSGRPLVRSVLFRLHFVEVNKSLLEKIGIQWSKDAAGPTLAGQAVPLNDGIYRNLPPAQPGDNLLDNPPKFVTRNNRNSGIFFGLATVIASRINLGVSDGDARILASPELTAKSGGKARLQVGGEIPIPMAGAFGSTTVEFKPYGIIFSIEPLIDAEGNISAKLSTELSQIDPAVTIAGIPGFLTRSTATEISVKPGEMIALSGLINSELSTAIDKVPGIGNIPILGRLFRSDDFRSKKTDLVVLLEPEIITPGDGIANQLRERGMNNTQEFKDKVQALQPSRAPALRSNEAGQQ